MRRVHTLFKCNFLQKCCLNKRFFCIRGLICNSRSELLVIHGRCYQPFVNRFGFIRQQPSPICISTCTLWKPPSPSKVIILYENITECNAIKV